MTQTTPATCVLGPGKTGLTIGLRVLNLDGTEYAAYSATGVTETSIAGTYRKAGGVVAPLAGGYIVWGTALVDYAEATVESASANVTMVKGAAINDLVDGNVVVKLAAAQGAVEFGQVKITADVPNQGALHVVNSNADGQGVLYTGGEYGQISQGGRAGVLGVDEPGIRTAIGMAAANLDTQLAALPTAEENTDAVWDELLSGHTIPGSAGAAGDPWSTALPGAYGAGTAGALLSGIDSNVDLLLAADTSTSDATAVGAISRRRGNSWAIPLTIGAITGYTSLWFSIKSSYDDADTAALVQVKLNSPSALDGLLYVNGTTASSAALGSITVSDATTGAIVVNVDETITDDLAPGTYYYDVQTLITGAVATPDSGVFTVTADVTRSVA